MARITFTTLGPPGTNHEFVTRKYLGFHGLTATADLQLSASVDEAVERIRAGTADYFVLCSVHPNTPRAVGRHYREMFVVDSFISPSLPLAVLTRADIEHPTSIGVLHPVHHRLYRRGQVGARGAYHDGHPPHCRRGPLGG